MNKQKIIVPEKIRYISDWSDYQEKYLLGQPHILDKQIPGCGYTEWALTCNLNVIWISPRCTLLDNKFDQHPGEVFYAKNELDVSLGVDKDISSIQPVNPVEADRALKEYEEFLENEKKKKIGRQDQYNKLRASLSDWCNMCYAQKRYIKIIVTYDSYYLVKDILLSFGIFNNFYNVVDEFQTIFMDSVFKSNTEMKFLSALQGVQYLVYVSATPMMSQYLEKIPEFANLPVLELDWSTADPGRVCKPLLYIRKTNCVTVSIRPEIEKYKKGQFPTRYVTDPTTGAIKLHISNEMVIYVNSVNNIINIINKCKLGATEVNILCANTIENQKRIARRLGKEYKIGRVLTRQDLQNGAQQKMFTFCTRTVYLGSDFYSFCAKSYILSDTNIQCITIDISLDLPQILGRQRLEENPWRNEADFYYSLPYRNTNMNADQMEENIEKKSKATKGLIEAYNSSSQDSRDSLVDVYRREAITSNYKFSYVAVNEREIVDPITGVSTIEYFPTTNNLVMISDQRAYDIQQFDYKDRFTVFNSINSAFGNEDINDKMTDFMDEYEKMGTLRDKLKILCEYGLTEDERQTLVYNQLNGTTISRYYIEFGYNQLKSCSYNTNRLTNRLHEQGKFNKEELGSLITGYFQIGNVYPLSDIKRDLQDFYNRCGYNQRAKASDIEKYLLAKKTKSVITVGGIKKSVECYKIVGVL